MDVTAYCVSASPVSPVVNDWPRAALKSAPVTAVELAAVLDPLFVWEISTFVVGIVVLTTKVAAFADRLRMQVAAAATQDLR
jgi:hypothetical protein